jgi:hypothetical protein
LSTPLLLRVLQFIITWIGTYTILLMHWFIVFHDLMNLLKLISIADQDSVRLLAVEGCAALGKLLEPQDCVSHILPVIVNFSQVWLMLLIRINQLFLLSLNLWKAILVHALLLTCLYKPFYN